MYLSLTHPTICRSNIAMIQYCINHCLLPLTFITCHILFTYKLQKNTIFKLLFCLHWCWSTSNLQCTGIKSAASLGLYLKVGFKGGPKRIGDYNQVIFFFKYWPSCGLDFKVSSLCLQCLLLKWMGSLVLLCRVYPEYMAEISGLALGTGLELALYEHLGVQPEVMVHITHIM